ncbi:hypothetical protein DPSP01_001402 [Paraphaeosphaeria sporulosa]
MGSITNDAHTPRSHQVLMRVSRHARPKLEDLIQLAAILVTVGHYGPMNMEDPSCMRLGISSTK